MLVNTIKITACKVILALSAGVLSAHSVLADRSLAEDSRFELIRLSVDKSATQLATEYLNDHVDAWQISELNGRTSFRAGDIVSLPKTPVNPTGVYANRTRSIPILCYHQFTAGQQAERRLEVSADNFERQMAFLAESGFHVISLKKLSQILQGKTAIPPRAVVLTIDDGYRSVYTQAYPILKKYGFSATLFVYTDFIGGSAALSWQQIKTMNDSGVIDVGSHTKTHASLAFDPQQETADEHQRRIIMEIDGAAKALKKRLNLKPSLLAYPYGDSSPYVVDYLASKHYDLAATVKRGDNMTYADPLLLQRTMIYNHHSLSDFKKLLSPSRYE